MQKVYNEILKDKFFNHTLPIYHWLDLLITIWDLHIESTWKNKYIISLWDININTYGSIWVIDTIKEIEPFKSYINN